MLWDLIVTDPDKRALAEALIERVPQSGWSERTLTAASAAALHNAQQWREVFPGGVRDAIWFIGEVSDASMKLPFQASPAPTMSAVIAIRLHQNRHLKSFVRKVMLFDLLHPIQAVARMQRTARVMFECLPGKDQHPSRFAIAGLNLVYTAIVFVWLFDRTRANELTTRMTRMSMRLIGLR